jgi:hypothetical protein
LASVEVNNPDFSKSISVEYEEFDTAAFFEEIMPFVRTPHRLYKIEDDELHILVGVTHPILFKVKVDKKKLSELESKLRAYGFKKGKWEWK